MFNVLDNLKASIFGHFLQKLDLEPGFTIFVPTDKIIKAYAKHYEVSVDFLLKSPSFVNIMKNHITYDKLVPNKKLDLLL